MLKKPIFTLQLGESSKLGMAKTPRINGLPYEAYLSLLHIFLFVGTDLQQLEEVREYLNALLGV